MHFSHRVIGIDISGKCLDIHILPEGMAKRYANDVMGIGEVVELAKEVEANLVVMESTGGLEVALAAECALAHIPTVVMSPRQIRDFARSMGRLAKTDTIDAEVIALFGAAVHPEPRALADEQVSRLKALVARRRQVVEMIVSERNRLLRARPFRFLAPLEMTETTKSLASVQGSIEIRGFQPVIPAEAGIQRGGAGQVYAG